MRRLNINAHEKISLEKVLEAIKVSVHNPLVVLHANVKEQEERGIQESTPIRIKIDEALKHVNSVIVILERVIN